MPVGLETFIAVDADWRLVFVSEAGAGILGLAPDEVAGRDIRELPAVRQLAPPPALDEGFARLREAMERRATAEFAVSTGDGGGFRCRAYPLEGGGLGIHVYDAGERARGP